MFRAWRYLTRSAMAVAIACPLACGLPTRQEVDLAQTVVEMGDAFQEMQFNQQDLQARLDSLATQVARQDSLLRVLANLLGSPLPPR
jgi:hypothetical protein